jgi:hypothetical protein
MLERQFFFLVILAMSLCCCGTIDRRLVHSDPAQKPVWVDEPPQTAEIVSFSSRSSRCASEPEARQRAWQTAIVQIAMYYGITIQSETVEHTLFVQNTEGVKEFYENASYSRWFSTASLKEISPHSYYTEVYRDGYEVVILTVISRQKIRDDIQEYKETIPRAYTERIVLLEKESVSLLSALREYAGMRRNLQVDPILKAEVYYNDQRLYDYLEYRLHKLIDSFTIEPIDEFSIKKGESQQILSKVECPLLPEIGPFEYHIRVSSLSDPNRFPFPGPVKTIHDNMVSVEIDTRDLPVGKYRFTFEILVNRIVPSIKKNITRSFYVEVIR